MNYTTGSLSYPSMNWNWNSDGYPITNFNPLTNAGAGAYPSIAQASSPGYGTQFIVFYQSANCGRSPCSINDSLVYQTGTLNTDGQTISWGPEQGWSGGDKPSVAIYPIGPGQFFVVDAHQGQPGSGALWMDFGVLQYGSPTVQWTGHTTQYDNGLDPSVAICSEPGGAGAAIIEVHNGGWGSNLGWYRTGRIESCNGYAACYTTLGGDWYELGQNFYNPTVACTQYWGYEVHQDAPGGGGLWQMKFTIN
jgi:hypothetical protein